MNGMDHCEVASEQLNARRDCCLATRYQAIGYQSGTNDR
jgi:hypothetical protein